MKQDFIKTFNKKLYQLAIDRVGIHNNGKIPTNLNERLIFSLLEIIDFECCIYGDFPCDEIKLKEFMKKHAKEIKKYKDDFASMIGLFARAFDFLDDDIQQYI